VTKPDSGVTAAVRRDLVEIGKRSKGLADSTLAASALALAAELDDRNSATSKSMCAKELRETIAALWAQCPAEEEADGIDELAKRRAARRAG